MPKEKSIHAAAFQVAEGVRLNQRYHEESTRARAIGNYVGHFLSCRGGVSPEEQVDFMLQHSGITKGEMYGIEWDLPPVTGAGGPMMGTQDAQKCVDLLRTKTGIIPILISNYQFWNTRGWHHTDDKFHLILFGSQYNQYKVKETVYATGYRWDNFKLDDPPVAVKEFEDWWSKPLT